MKKGVIFLVIVMLILGLGLTISARMQNPQGEVITREVIAGGGGKSITVGQRLNVTIGQPTIGVSQANNGTILVSGFQTLVLTSPSVTATRQWQLYY